MYMKVIRIKQNENGKWTIEGIDNITDLINYEKSKAKELNDEELLYGELRDEELLDSYFEQDLKRERELRDKEAQSEFKKEFENTFIKILKEHELKKLEEEEEEVKKKIFIENEKKTKKQEPLVFKKEEPIVFNNESVKITREQPVKITNDVKENHPEKAIIANAKKMSKYIERAEGEIKVLNDRIKKLTNTLDKYAELQLEIKNIIDMYKRGMVNTEFIVNRLSEVQRIYNR